MSYDDLKELIDNVDGFLWDSGNISKNKLKHKVSEREAEEVFLNEPIVFFEDDVHSIDLEARYGIYGHTDKNRFLTIFFTIRKRKIRIISARNQTKNETREYINYFSEGE